jgi:hypothetical protein
VLVGMSGVDGAGKGYLAGRLHARLAQAGLRVAMLNVDGWLNLPALRFPPSARASISTTTRSGSTRCSRSWCCRSGGAAFASCALRRRDRHGLSRSSLRVPGCRCRAGRRDLHLQAGVPIPLRPGGLDRLYSRDRPGPRWCGHRKDCLRPRPEGLTKPYTFLPSASTWSWTIPAAAPTVSFRTIRAWTCRWPAPGEIWKRPPGQARGARVDTGVRPTAGGSRAQTFRRAHHARAARCAGLCAANQAGESDAAEPARIEIENRSSFDMDVYVRSDRGGATRSGSLRARRLIHPCPGPSGRRRRSPLRGPPGARPVRPC